jgi:myo-inositol-1(or 4)-monophosphatase
VRELLHCAVEAAKAGGRELAARKDHVGAVRTKGFATDYVSESDIASGVAVARAILGRYPNARFVIEEDEVYDLASATRGDLDDDEVWVIDPIDGTTSFLHGYPNYSVSVACMRDAQPVAGAVYNAALDEMNAGALGLGATRDGRRLLVGDATSVSEALLITGFPYDRGAPLDRQLDILGAFLRYPVQGIRRDGSAALDCCHVAGERADGFWELYLKPWDTGAGVIILREAGATVTDMEGRPWDAHSESICCANPILHAKMLEVIEAASA